MADRARLSDRWATGDAHPKTIARELFRQLGKQSTVLSYALGGKVPRFYIVRFTDNGEGERVADPERPGESYENPRPWSRPLEILGVADDLAKVLWILRSGKPAALVTSRGGVKPRLDGSGNWIGFASAGDIEISAGLLELCL